MMRSWGNRTDTFVCDEPLYAHYLKVTKRVHPGADEVIAAGETDLMKVIDWLTGPVPQGRRIFYQKHMAQHLLPGMDRAWVRGLTNCFLIREPREVLASFVQHVPDAVLGDTGFVQQLELFELVRKWTGDVPPVIDARDVLNDPRVVLWKLCERLGVEFTEKMLAWPPGLRDTDGIWAKYWYKEVETTTGFQPYRAKERIVPESLRGALSECEKCYHVLYEHRIRA
jgi:hypothetical protein